MSQDYYSVRTLNAKGQPQETRYYRDGSSKTLSAKQTEIADNIGLVGRSIAKDDGEAYFGKDDKNESTAYNIGRWINKHITPEGGNVINKFLKGTGSLGGAGLYGLTGLGAGALLDALTGSRRGKWLGALGGGVLGYVLGSAANSGNNYTTSDAWGNVRPNPDASLNKKASFFGDAKQEVLSALFSASGMSSSDKTRAISIIKDMPSYQLSPLARALRSASGAAIGAIVMRFLLGAGKWGTALGALAGGLLGGFASGPKRTSGLFDYQRY